jgi:hypothetical protein
VKTEISINTGPTKTEGKPGARLQIHDEHKFENKTSKCLSGVDEWTVNISYHKYE